MARGLRSLDGRRKRQPPLLFISQLLGARSGDAPLKLEDRGALLESVKLVG